MRIVNVAAGSTQAWGKTGESEAVLLKINAEPFIRDWPEGSPQAVYTRPDGVTYNVPCTRDGSHAVVILSGTETVVEGVARVEVWWIDGGVVAKTDTYKGKIEKSLGDPGAEPPEPLEGYIERIAKIGAHIDESVALVQEIVKQYSRIPLIPGTMLYVDANGVIQPLNLGDGLEIVQ